MHYGGGKITTRFSDYLHRIYAVIEIIIGLFGFFSIQLIRWVNHSDPFNIGGSFYGDFISNMLLLALPTLLMGMTTPIIIHHLKEEIENFGEVIGVFYGFNIIGAAVGAIASIFLIELLHLSGVIFLSAAINVLIGLAFLFYGKSKRLSIQKQEALNSDIQLTKGTPLSFSENSKIKASIFLFGFVNLSFQMIIFRILSFYFNPFPFLFPSILCVFLLFMSLGQTIGGKLIDKIKNKTEFLVFLFLGGFGSFLIAVTIPFVAIDQIYARINSPLLLIITTMILSVPFLLPTAFFSAYLPSISRLLIRNIEEAGNTFGGTLFWSTMGNVFGAFVTPMFLFDVLGTVTTCILTSFFCFFAILLINKSNFISSHHGKISKSSLRICLVALMVFSFFFPKEYFHQSFADIREISKDIGRSKPIEIFEGKSSVTSIYFDQINPFRMVIRPFSMRAAAAHLDTHHGGVSYFSLAVPQALTTSFHPQRVLELGLGDGVFPYIIKELPSVKEIVLVELTPEVIHAFQKYSHKDIKAILKHPKVKLELTDARRYIQRAIKTGEKFDVIQVGVQTHRKGTAGVSSLYTRELFQKIVKLLNPGGILIVEPYIAVCRLAFEFFEYGYTVGDASWIFMTNKPLPKSGSIPTDPYILNLMHSGSDINLIHSGSNYSDAHSFVKEYRRNEIIKKFPNMICMDDRPIFEYYYIASLFSDYVKPTELIYEINDLKYRRLEYTFVNKTRATG